MKRISLLFFVFLINYISVLAQCIQHPYIPERSTDLKGFIPNGWELLDYCEGDINGDGYSDIVLILQTKNSLIENKQNQYFKLLIIAFYDPTKRDYYIVEKSEEFLNPHSLGMVSETFNSVSFDKEGNLRFDFNLLWNGSVYWKGNSNYTFRYHEEQLELIRQEREIPFCSNKQYISYLYRLALLTIFETENNIEKRYTKHGSFELNKLPTFKTIGRPGGISDIKIYWDNYYLENHE